MLGVTGMLTIRRSAVNTFTVCMFQGPFCSVTHSEVLCVGLIIPRAITKYIAILKILSNFRSKRRAF